MFMTFIFFEFLHVYQVRYIGVSNETSYGVMEFVHTAKVEGLPKIVSIQNSYSLLVRSRFEGKYNSHINDISFIYRKKTT